MTNKELAVDIVRRFPDTPTNSLARKLYDEHRENFNTLNSADCCIRRVRGNFGNEHRKYAVKDIQRPNGPAEWVPSCPPAIVEAWEPYILPGRRVLVLSDIHVPFHSPKSLETALAYARNELNPDCVLLNGDVSDFFRISRHDKDPTRVGGLKAEMEAVAEVLQWIMSAFPKAKTVYKLGNHEERLDHYIWNKAPELLDVAQCRMWELKQLQSLKIKWVADKRPVMAGELPILHGHEFGRSISAPVNPARGAFLRTKHTVLIGHLHRASTHAEPNMFGSETTCWSAGCLCGLNPQWLPINSWTHGFAFVNVQKDGEFDLHNYKINKAGRVRTV